jgi:hypothetical protein
MKTSKTILLAALALGISATLTLAQDEPQGPGGNRPPRQGGGQGGGQGGPGGGQRMMGGPLMAALDANHDGTIDEKEIANASAALKTLDKNGDGKLTAEELRPQRPQGGQGGPGGQGRPPGGQPPTQ